MNTKVVKGAEPKVNKFDQGHVFKVLLRTAVPIILLMILNSTYAFIDSLMSSHYVVYRQASEGVVELNGGTSIGLIFPLMGMLLSFQIIHSAGSSLAFAKTIATNEDKKLKTIVGQTVDLSFLIGIVTIVFIALIGIPYLYTVSGNWHNQHWQDQTWNMVLDGYFYMLALGFSFVPMNILNSYTRILRAEGRGSIAAIISICTLPINIFFDWLFMSYAGIGLIGAGLATFIASSFGLIGIMLYVYMVNRKEKKIHFSFKPTYFKLNKEIIILILIFGLGSFYRRIFDSTTQILTSLYIGNMKVDDLSFLPKLTASWTMMTRSLNMAVMAIIGVGQAMSMMISFYNGSEQEDKIKDTVKYGLLIMVVVQLLIICALLLLGGVLFKAYSIDIGPGYVYNTLLGKLFIIVVIGSTCYALQILPALFYAGMKQPKKTLIHTMVFNLVILLFISISYTIETHFASNHNAPLIFFIGFLIGSFVSLFLVYGLFLQNLKTIFKKTI